MIYPKIPLAQSIINICLAKGLINIVISPGSRNAPLTIGFVNNPNFKCYSIADERCAAFFALGLAQQLLKPVAVVCTSGSALLNYYPAFAEAFYSQIPLVVLSADRPFNKIDIGDGQTIRQKNVFANHSLYNADLTEGACAQNDLWINEAIDAAFFQKGPTHINAPFEEPLYETTDLKIKSNIFESFESIFKKETPNLESFLKIWNKCCKKMILVGVNNPNEILDVNLQFLASDNSVVVLTETTSNLHDLSFINNIDTIITPLTEVECEQFSPEILVTFGGMLVSKRIKSFLRKHQPKHHWHIDLQRAYDTFGCLTAHIEMHPNDFWNQIRVASINIESDYYEYINQIKILRGIRTKQYLEKIPFSDFKAFEKIIESLPKNSMFQVSNSSAIRYAQLIDIDPTISVFSNRGTSGIDGSTSTAIGAAVGSDLATVFVTGDIGFLYDSNALWNNYIPKNFKLIVINNGGGGIFRILPGHDETEVFNEFFETSHCLTAENLAKMYNLQYAIASTTEGLESELKKMYQHDDKPYLLEIFTPTRLNDQILLQFFKELE